MRCTHTISGLLSIVGAAFLISTVHALVAEPVDLSKVELNTGDADVKGRDRTPREPEPEPVEEPERAGEGETEAGTEAETEAGTEADLAPGTETSASDAMLDAPVPEGTLTLRQAHSLWDQGAYFIDARKEEEFLAGHIQYADWLISAVFEQDSDRAFAVLDAIPTDATVVIYCVGGECDASHNTARQMRQAGYTDLRIMGVGYDAWVEAGFPTEEGGAP